MVGKVQGFRMSVDYAITRLSGYFVILGNMEGLNFTDLFQPYRNSFRNKVALHYTKLFIVPANHHDMTVILLKRT